MSDPYPPRPWRFDPEDLDEEEFRVIRAGDGRPLAFIAKELSPNAQDDLAKLIVRAPYLLAACRTLFFTQQENGVPKLTQEDWNKWRNFVGPVLAELWARWI